MDKETEALAKVLYALYWESIGKHGLGWDETWDEVQPPEREAWIQVAQFIDANKNRPSWMTEQGLKEANAMYERWGYGIPDHK